MASEYTSRGRRTHALHPELNSAYRSCVIRPREVQSEVVSVHLTIYLGLDVHGHGPCINSLHPGGSM
jgi:hypothetical protein